MGSFQFKLLELFTTDLPGQKRFYGELLQLPIVAENDLYFICAVGESFLKFTVREYFRRSHFAFNIPSNQIHEAKSWLNSEIFQLKDKEDSIIPYESWNAEAIYFYDYDGNVVELIARKNLAINSNENFTANSILGISEVGLPCDNIAKLYQKLSGRLSLPLYCGDDKYFCAAGDESALLILVNQNQKKWFPTIHAALPADVNITIEQGGKEIFLSYRDGEPEFSD
ncbi:VOC family protein [Mangrovibacterium sp.]|uniref:VOC family protein n=1 Tax=Mangrovibacterium sp. TaxID=1961364 RepID=UPI003565E7FE